MAAGGRPVDWKNAALIGREAPLLAAVDVAENFRLHEGGLGVEECPPGPRPRVHGSHTMGSSYPVSSLQWNSRASTLYFGSRLAAGTAGAPRVCLSRSGVKGLRKRHKQRPWTPRKRVVFLHFSLFQVEFLTSLTPPSACTDMNRFTHQTLAAGGQVLHSSIRPRARFHHCLPERTAGLCRSQKAPTASFPP